VLVRHQTYSWRIFHATDSSPITSQLLGPGHRFPFCDIFVMRPHKGRWDLRDKEGRHVWPHENYSIQQVAFRLFKKFFSLFFFIIAVHRWRGERSECSVISSSPARGSLRSTWIGGYKHVITSFQNSV